MYEEYFNLNRKPFQFTTDPSFLWMGPKHSEALAILEYGIRENKGFLLLTGDVGTGKTTLVHALMKRVCDDVYLAKISDPGLSRQDFYRMVSRQFGFADGIENRRIFYEFFIRFLLAAQKNNKNVLLIIDESQRMNPDILEEIRFLSKIKKQNAKLLTIFFVGQNEFSSLLLRPENRALRKRVAITYNLDPLDKHETVEYIKFRLRTAGAKRKIFSAGAVNAIYNFSSGSPRQINIICDLALLYGFQANKKSISKKLILNCRDSIHFPLESIKNTENRKKDIPKDRKVIKNSVGKGKRPDIRTGYSRELALAIMLLVFIGLTGYFFLPISSDQPFHAPNPQKNRITLPIPDQATTFGIGRVNNTVSYDSEDEETLAVSYRIGTDNDAHAADTVMVPGALVDGDTRQETPLAHETVKTIVGKIASVGQPVGLINENRSDLSPPDTIEDVKDRKPLIKEEQTGKDTDPTILAVDESGKASSEHPQLQKPIKKIVVTGNNEILNQKDPDPSDAIDWILERKQ